MIVVVGLAIIIAVSANDWRWGAAFGGICWAASTFVDF